MKHNEFKFKTFDGLTLFGQSWQPDEQPRAAICLVHGMGEHSGRYVQLAARLAGAGYFLLSFDLRGHGRSECPRGHTPSYEALMNDIDSFLKKTKQDFSPIPIFLYGHSLGGNLVLNYVLRQKPQIRGIVATSPLLRIAYRVPSLKLLLAKITNHIWPSYCQSSGLEVGALSREVKIVQDYQEDPLVHDRISARMFLSVYQAGQWALMEASEFLLPLLLMHGGGDRITSVKASREFADKVKENGTLKIWDGLYHELHHEPEKEEVFQFLIHWLDKKI